MTEVIYRLVDHVAMRSAGITLDDVGDAVAALDWAAKMEAWRRERNTMRWAPADAAEAIE